MSSIPPPRIAIIGAGFSGTALAISLDKRNQSHPHPAEIMLFEQSGAFGVGAAYATPYPFHFLNVRSHDMSVFEDEPNHFVNWLEANVHQLPALDHTQPLAKQFVPRLYYRMYLQSLLAQCHLQKITATIVDIKTEASHIELISSTQEKFIVDKVVFALGNNQVSPFPFPITDTQVLANPWAYHEVSTIPAHAPVLLVGTGLSMIDTVLSLYHQGHQAKIYATSRHGLLPLPHSDTVDKLPIDPTNLPKELLALSTYVRQASATAQDWVLLINALRPYTAMIWQQWSRKDKKRFLRHGLSYWNVHRHRVDRKIYTLLQSLMSKGQLHILAGRIQKVAQEEVSFLPRHHTHLRKFKAAYVINCLGPQLSYHKNIPPCVTGLLQSGQISLDALSLGFNTNALGAMLDINQQPSLKFFALGPPTKGVNWECTAVPDIRKQTYVLAKHL